jgi:hypothetical protein
MFAAFLSLFALVGGQTPAPAAQVSPPPAPAAGNSEPDILISVGAHADEVRWRQVGTVTVRAWSEPGGSILDENISTGLPRPIPGRRTFRDVNWTLRAGACIASPEPANSIPPTTAAVVDPGCQTTASPSPQTGDVRDEDRR